MNMVVQKFNSSKCQPVTYFYIVTARFQLERHKVQSDSVIICCCYLVNAVQVVGIVVRVTRWTEHHWVWGCGEIHRNA